jgi:streptogramin lyase
MFYLVALTAGAAIGGEEGVPPASGGPLRQVPRVAEVPSNLLPQADWLATPEVRTLVGYTRRVLHLPDGHTLAVCSFSNAAPANWLFLIDSRDLSTERYPIPHNDIASHGAALGADGYLYFMPYGTGRAYRFDVSSKQFEPLETGLPPGEYTWEALGASNGCIYFGTYPHAYLGEYNPATGRCSLWRQVAEDTKYTTAFREDQEGRIHFKAWGPAEIEMTFDPRSRLLERRGDAETRQPEGGKGTPSVGETPPFPEGDTAFQRQVAVGDRRFVLSFPSSRLWEVRPEGTLTLCGDPGSPAEVWFLEAVPGAVVGISHFGALFRYDLETGQFLTGQLPNRAPAGNSIMFIETVTPRCVIGAHYSQQNLFRIDPETGAVAQTDQMVARVTGEPMCAVGLNGKAYLGIYVQSILSVYDPEQPFAFGKNPRELIELGSRYAQTRPRDAVTDGRQVFISSDSAYNHLGGALAVIDPETEQVEVYPHLIRDQNLPSLAFDPTTGLLWGGTDRWGQMRSHPPTQESSLIYAFDPDARQVVATLIPWPGADVTTVLGVSKEGILVATEGTEIALIDTARREILYRGRFPLPIPGKVRRGSDGHCYCLAGGTLYRWDLPRNTLTPVAASPGCVFLTEPSPGTWLLANAASIYRVRLSP